MTPEETRARLLYRDGLMLILDKPAGVAVHRGPKGGASLEDDFDALRFGLPRNPALAHRLDRDTAGCLVLGRHHKALEKLGRLFKQGKIDKTYWAIVAGAPEAESGTIDLALGRLDDKRGWWMKVDPNGQPATTLWRVRGRGAWRGQPIAWLELEPRTGRTHQLRVHCAAQGWPILGDAIYGAPADVSLQLLARKVVVPLSNAGPPIEVAGAGPAAHGGGAHRLRIRGPDAIIGAAADRATALSERRYRSRPIATACPGGREQECGPQHIAKGSSVQRETGACAGQSHLELPSSIRTNLRQIWARRSSLGSRKSPLKGTKWISWVGRKTNPDRFMAD